MKLSRTDRNTLHSLLFIALPAIVQSMMGTLMQYVDTAMVGRLGEQATAAVSVTTTVGWLLAALPYSVGIGCVSLISQAFGAKQEQRLREGAMLGVFFGCVIGLALTVLSLSLARYIPGWMQAEEEIRPEATRYFFIISLPTLPRCAGIVLGCLLQAVEDTRSPMRASLVSNAANVLLNALLIYALRLGVLGAAIATAASTLLNTALLLHAFLHTPLLRFSFRDFVLRRSLVRELLDAALPALGTTAASCMGYVVFAGMVSGMGTILFAAHSIAINAEEIFYIPGYGLRTATSTLSGVAMGERNIHKFRAVRRWSVILTLGMMAISGVLLYFFAYPLMRVFTSSAAVAEQGAAVLRIVAFSEPFFGLTIVWEGISYGLGKTRSVFLVETLSMWGVRILLTYFVTQVWHLGLEYVWFCMIADNICKALALTLVRLREDAGFAGAGQTE